MLRAMIVSILLLATAFFLSKNNFGYNESGKKYYTKEKQERKAFKPQELKSFWDKR